LAAVAAALAASAIWLAVIVWRIARDPAMLWRGPLLAAVGLTTQWFVLNALFLPAADFKRSYEPLARDIERQAELIAPGGCIYAFQLRPAHRAMLAYHGGIRFGGPDCPVALHRDSWRARDDDAPPPGNWIRYGSAAWPGRPDEWFHLYRRGPA
jgi:hypothetical protein